jgi:hypothetical protein
VKKKESLEVPCYYSSRLEFRAEVIEPLGMQDSFCVHTPHGTFQMTKADFHRDFLSVVNSSSYRDAGAYHYTRAPAKALRYLTNTAPHARPARPRVPIVSLPRLN